MEGLIASLAYVTFWGYVQGDSKTFKQISLTSKENTNKSKILFFLNYLFVVWYTLSKT